MRHRPLIHLVIILAIALTSSLAVCGKDDVPRTSSGGGEKSSIAVRVVSPLQVLVPRLKSGDQPWEFSHLPIARKTALGLPIRQSSSAAVGTRLRSSILLPVSCRLSASTSALRSSVPGLPAESGGQEPQPLSVHLTWRPHGRNEEVIATDGCRYGRRASNASV